MNDTPDCWTVLGIDATDEPRAIRLAYAARLKACRPEDDPSAFKRLRDAYADALRRARDTRHAASGPPPAPAPAPADEVVATDSLHARPPVAPVDSPAVADTGAQPQAAPPATRQPQPGQARTPEAMPEFDEPRAVRWLEQLYALLEDNLARAEYDNWRELIEHEDLLQPALRDRISFEAFGALAGWMRQTGADPAEAATRQRVLTAFNERFNWHLAEPELAARFHSADIDRVLAHTEHVHLATPPPAIDRNTQRLLRAVRIVIFALLVVAAGLVLLPDAPDHPAYAALREQRFADAIELAHAHLADVPDDINMRAVLAEAHAARREFSAALTAMQAVIDAEPSAQRYSHRASIHERAGDWYNATLDRRAALQAQPDDAALMNALAWNLATVPDPYVRDGAEAVRLARAALAATGGRNPAYVDTLAAALAESGDFGAAVATQRRAISLADADEVRTQGYSERLRLYQAGQPYRLEAPTLH